MKATKLTKEQTDILENMGVDVTADVLVPHLRGPGHFSYCTYCYHQRFTIIGGTATKVCGNPLVKNGLRTCFFLHKEEGCAES